MEDSCNTIVSHFAVDAEDSSEEELGNVSVNSFSVIFQSFAFSFAWIQTMQFTYSYFQQEDFEGFQEIANPTCTVFNPETKEEVKMGEESTSHSGHY